MSGLTEAIEHVLDEWRETMKGDAKYEAVARGVSGEIRAVLAAAGEES